jgi:hypothetical protein
MHVLLGTAHSFDRKTTACESRRMCMSPDLVHNFDYYANAREIRRMILSPGTVFKSEWHTTSQ